MRAMGTDVHFLLHGMDQQWSEGLVGHLEEYTNYLERLWSRFLPSSEISQLNTGARTKISSETRLLLESMEAGYLNTRGAFNPSTHARMSQLGYASDYTSLTGTVGALPENEALVALEMHIDGEYAQLAVGVSLDPGGIGKGLACDLLAQRASELGASSILVDIGGDMRAYGEHTWDVDVPWAELGVSLPGGTGLATSHVKARNWGQQRWHILDPQTGLPLESAQQWCTVMAPSAAQAEVWTKALLVAPDLTPPDKTIALLGDEGREVRTINTWT